MRLDGTTNETIAQVRKCLNSNAALAFVARYEKKQLELDDLLMYMIDLPFYVDYLHARRIVFKEMDASMENLTRLLVYIREEDDLDAYSAMLGRSS